MFENLGQALSLIREMRGKSQAQVARAAGIGKSQLSKYENRKELPRFDSLQKILIALEVGYSEFFHTLQLIDQRAATLGQAPNGRRVATSPSSAVLSQDLEDAFDLVFALLSRLQRRVWEQMLAAGTGRPELAREVDREDE
ncbi:MAG TPA: helix-turn-helix transcriptional regulator [Thermoanaerobaculia bacterium]|jgi:transcriptional regulator with XRE-family HTH domain